MSSGASTWAYRITPLSWPLATYLVQPLVPHRLLVILRLLTRSSGACGNRGCLESILGEPALLRCACEEFLEHDLGPAATPAELCAVTNRVSDLTDLMARSRRLPEESPWIPGQPPCITTRGSQRQWRRCGQGTHGRHSYRACGTHTRGVARLETNSSLNRRLTRPRALGPEVRKSRSQRYFRVTDSIQLLAVVGPGRSRVEEDGPPV